MDTRESISSSRPSQRFGLVFFALLVAVAVTAGGWFYYRHQYSSALKTAQETLVSVDDLKVTAVEKWLDERRGDTEVMRNSLMARGVLSNSKSADARQLAVKRFEVWRNVYHYAAVMVSDSHGVVQSKAPSNYPLPEDEVAAHAQRALRSPRSVQVDLHRAKNGKVLLWLAGCVFKQLQATGPPDGVFISVVDPQQFLYPFIAKWPTPSKSAETLLVSHDGDYAVFLTPLRHASNAPLTLRIPIDSSSQLPSVKMFRGDSDIAEGQAVESLDYRDIQVLSVVRSIAGTPWVMVSKVDEEELFAPLRREAYEIAIISALILIVLVLSVGSLGRQQKLIYVRANEARFRMLIEQAPTAISISRGNSTVYVNKQYLDLYGFNKLDEATSSPVTDRWSPEFREVIAKRIDQRARGEVLPSEYEGVGQRRDGSQFPVSIAVASVELSDGKASLAFINDITDRKNAEVELKTAYALLEEERKSLEVRVEQRTAELSETNAKLAHADRAKSDFLANMSHEIRTPMNAVIGMTHLALGTDLNSRQRNYLEKIDTSARSLLNIINDILDYSKIESGKLIMESVVFSLESVFHNLADLLSDKAQEKGLEFLFHWDAGVPARLTGDPLRLGQILINLTSNAIKFTETGEVAIRVEKVTEDENQVVLRFSVHDTGIGLTDTQRERLFQPFSQADTSTTRKYGGTGLGLSICHHLVNMMSGHIEVDSQPGQGSTFSFTAAFGRCSSGNAEDTEYVNELDGLSVLVVDDNATSRGILTGMLESFRFKVSSVSSGANALAALESADASPMDLVLLDWQMPEMDGIETARRIRDEARIARKPPIIMVSAYGREELVQQSAKVGVASFLIKPVSPSVLLDTVMQVFNKNRQFTSTRVIETQQSGVVWRRELRLLLVEDNDINREVALEMLGAAGMEVEVAENGAQGLAAVRAAAEADRPFHVVLMDCQMPVMDGYEATRLLRQDERFAKLPIIALTANAMAGDRELCLAAGMNEHLTKPFEPKGLLAAIEKWAPSDIVREQVERGEQGTSKSLDPGRCDATGFADLSLPGVDLNAGLNRVNYKLGLYRDMLERFRRGQGGTVSSIRAALQAGDTKDAMIKAHTLKGVAGNIGALDVAAAAGLVEESLRLSAEASIDPELESVEAALNPLLQAIDNLSNPILPPAVALDGDDASEPTPGMETLRPFVDELENLLRHNNTGAREAIAELVAKVRDVETCDILETMSRDIGAYDFRAALARWPALQSRLGANSAPESAHRLETD